MHQTCSLHACSATSSLQAACRPPLAACFCKQPGKHARTPFNLQASQQEEPRLNSWREKSTPSRRTALYSVAPVVFLPDIYRWLSTEISLWGQEAGYLSRRAQETVGVGSPRIQQAVPSLPLDERLAQALLDIPLEAAREVADDAYPGPVNFGAAFSKLKAQEQPYFEEYGACGSCGRDGLRDAAWFNFLSYIQYKTLNAELQPSDMPRVTANGFEYLHRNSAPMMLDMDAAEQQEATSSASQGSMEASLAFFANKDGRAISRYGGGNSDRSSTIIGRSDPNVRRVLAFQAIVGRKLLEYIESPEGPLSALEKELLAMKSAQLDVIRAGARVLLGALQKLGFLGASWVTAFGISGDEYENHTVWASGEPAFVKIWEQSPATERSETALQAEQGWSQDFVFLLLAAYLRRCGVSAKGFRRFPYVTRDSLISEQFTIRSTAAAPEEPNEPEAALLGQFPAFTLDKCPGGGTWDGLDEEADLGDAVGC
ncbi:hypothetical protein DUNSADRAFT_3655 [Dunaliella salina]|uniref:Uncharacterized protein n=1 Tax=Dunaliella salina TaxID=3046 RepID=A0ABQ7GTK1_DUNSA|nr:hypothetical protein DUNSADRAFT_3655 [Dunaliella salina]|eukprot:KAF5837934.1 hypothetical protein DUNSADRAFT_3655 [Dunaliella salina]